MLFVRLYFSELIVVFEYIKRSKASEALRNETRYLKKISFLQLNVGRRQLATQNLNNYLIKNNIDFAMLQEPYIERQQTTRKSGFGVGKNNDLDKYRLGYLSNRFNIFCTHDYETNFNQSSAKNEYNCCRQKTAIVFTNQNLNRDKVTPILLESLCDQNTTCVYIRNFSTPEAESNNIVLISSYFEPDNRRKSLSENLEQFKKLIFNLNFKIKKIKEEISNNIILCIDCNSHHSAWFNKKNDKRGNLFHEFNIANDFSIENNNNKLNDDYTFQVSHRVSANDSFSSSSDSESSSDELSSRSESQSDDSSKLDSVVTEESQFASTSKMTSVLCLSDFEYDSDSDSDSYTEINFDRDSNSDSSVHTKVLKSNIDLTLITSSLKSSLMNWKLIGRKVIDLKSDHLPIVFDLEFTNNNDNVIGRKNYIPNVCIDENSYKKIETIFFNYYKKCSENFLTKGGGGGFLA